MPPTSHPISDQSPGAAIRVLSLCTGIAGDAAALDQAGLSHTVLAVVEKDHTASAVLKQRFPETLNLGDLTTIIDWSRYNGQTDLLTAGLPCQPHSIAGRRKALEDERDLTRDFLRIVENVRPTDILVENVPQYQSSKRGGGACGVLLRGLRKLGYAADALVIDAADFQPQRRRRLWVLAHRRDAGASPAEILADAACGGGSPEQGDPIRLQDEPGASGGTAVLHPLRLGTLMASASGLNRAGMRGHEIDCLVVQNFPGIGLVVRRPTPLEALRAQGFPDKWLDDVTIEGRQLDDLERYKLVGNAWPVPVAAAILRRLYAEPFGHVLTA